VAVAFSVLAVAVAIVTAAIMLALRQRTPCRVGDEAGSGAATSSADLKDCPTLPVCLPMMFTLGNQLTMSGTLFGKPATFIVDSGFTFSVISARHKTTSDPKEILLEWDGDPGKWHPFKVRKWVATAQQTTNRLPLVEMGDDATTLGPHGTPTSMAGQLALVQPLGDMLAKKEYGSTHNIPLGGIVGASFMKRYVVIFDYVNRCISYTCSLPPQPAGTVKLLNGGRKSLGTLVVPATISYAGKTAKIRCCIDTGAGSCIAAQSVTRAILPKDDPARKRKAVARMGDGDLQAFEYIAPANNPLEMIFSNGADSVTVAPRNMLMLPEGSPEISAISGHSDGLFGTAVFQTLKMTVDYTADPVEIYIYKP
jgi:hypothetical protein